jgi:hypothetical protein
LWWQGVRWNCWLCSKQYLLWAINSRFVCWIDKELQESVYRVSC